MRTTETFTEQFDIGDLKIPSPPSLGEIGDKLAGPFKDAGNQFSKVGDEMKDGVNGLIDKVKNEVLGPLTDIFDKAKKAFTVIPDKFDKFGNSFKDIFRGIGEEVTGLFDGIGQGFFDITSLIEYSGIFLFMYVACGVKFIQNFHRCIFFYSLQTFGQIIYVPFRILLWVLKQIGADFYSTEKSIWDNIEKLDGIIYKNMGFHVIHYTRSVRDLCYNCKRMKQSTIKNKASDIDKDFRNGIREKLNRGIRTLKEAGDEFKAVFE